MRKTIAILCALVGVASTLTVLAVTALAGTAPSVRSLSKHSGAYWGGTTFTVEGSNFTKVRKVVFGTTKAWTVQVRSSKELRVTSPYHGYGTVTVRIVTATGTSAKNRSTSFTFRRPRMSDKIQGGLTGNQEIRLSKKVRKAHHNAPVARASGAWTPALGLTAARRATSWLGLPYSWAGGNGRGPTKGVCAGDGGDLDCRIVGFDCSGLTLYAWSPYKAMAHYAATQRRQAGKFHPAAGELVAGDLVFFSGYIPGGVGHVAIYVGNGMVVQAEQSGSTVMRSRLDDVIASHGTYRGATRPKSTGRQGAIPVVSGVTPQVSANGGLLTVTGTSLTSTTAVTVSGKRYYSFVSRTASTLVVKVPRHAAGKASIAISNAWGTVRRSTTYVAAPTLTSLTPATGPAAGGNAVTLTGRGLSKVTTVRVGTATVPFRPVSDTSLVLTMPALAAGARAGSVPVTVTSAFGTSKAVGYTYLTPTPSTSPAPTSTPSTTGPPVTAPGRTAGTGAANAPGTTPATTPVTTPPTSPATTPVTTPPATSTPATSAPETKTAGATAARVTPPAPASSPTAASSSG